MDENNNFNDDFDDTEEIEDDNYDDEINPLYDADYCYECSGYGDDTYIDDDGNIQSRCLECPFNMYSYDD